MSAMELVVNGLFLLAAAAAVRLWLRRRSPPSAWLAGTFGAIAVVIVTSLVLGEDAMAEAPAPVTRALVLVLLAAPYLLFRFADSVAGARTWLRRTADGLAGVVALATLVLPIPTGEATEGGAAETAYLVLVLSYWAGLTLVAGWLQWRRSREQSAIVRRRMRLLATATLGLGLLVPVSALVPEDAGTADLVVQGVSAVLGALFLVGFAPPAALRASWREPDERRVYGAAVAFMNAETDTDVSAVLVPGVRRMMGAASVRLRDASGEVVLEDPPDPPPTGPRVRVVTAPVGDRLLEVVVAPTVPLLGPEEDDELDRLALLADLAFERTRLLAVERATRLDLERANEDLESFVYTTSHDLKNPLLAILGYLEVIREDHGDELSDQLRHHLDRMAVNTEHMESLIRDLLELSRVGRVDVQPDRVDLGLLVDDLAAEVRSGRSRLHVERGALPSVWMNPTRARQLFTNLFDNAARHAAGDQVTVRVDATTGTDVVRVRVRDDGQGIPDAHLERVFGVFERLDANDEGGTGMGLAICRRVVELLDGRMWAEPSDDGASFVIELPASLTLPDGAATTAQDVGLLDRSGT